MSYDPTDPEHYWPGEEDHWPVSIGEDIPALISATLAVAAELRTANLIAYRVAAAGPLANFSNETLRPIRQRLGLDQ